MAFKKNNKLLHLRIVSPKGLLYSGDVSSVSSKNLAGDFDIIPYHANFISFIEENPIVVRKPNEKPIVFKFPFAIISNINDYVNIYTDIQINLNEV